jgi:hypothetical protein
LPSDLKIDPGAALMSDLQSRGRSWAAGLKQFFWEAIMDTEKEWWETLWEGKEFWAWGTVSTSQAEGRPAGPPLCDESKDNAGDILLGYGV